MEIKKIKTKDLNPAKYNPRKDLQPGDPEYEKLKKSILEFDYIDPIIWNKRTGRVVGGHQRLKILKELGRTEIDVSVVDLSEKKEKALNLALNKNIGDWDLPMLKDLLEDLDTGEFDDIEITGFDEEEIESLMTQFHVEEDTGEAKKSIKENECPKCGFKW
ncbi:MAG: ParB N-terminal domain-containing protein [Candidatus Thermoplasmatota archaeon]|nr:ParB N-terminal domain-containing protein [Candidatus Thermoplasmatota archaeon]